MLCRNPCRLYIHLAFPYSIGPSSVVWSNLGPAPPFAPMRVLEVWWSRALSLVCEVALIYCNQSIRISYFLTNLFDDEKKERKRWTVVVANTCDGSYVEWITNSSSESPYKALLGCPLHHVHVAGCIPCQLPTNNRGNLAVKSCGIKVVIE